MHRPTLNTAIKQNVSQQHEETPETLLFRGFFEEFSYENVNLYKGNFVERCTENMTFIPQIRAADHGVLGNVISSFR